MIMTTKEQIQQFLDDAWELRGRGNYKESRRLLDKAQKLCQSKDYEMLGQVFHIYMQHEFDHGNLNQALDYNKETISYYTKAKNPNKIAHAIRHRADLQNELGHIEEAEMNYIKAIDLYRDNPDSPNGDLANALRGYALLLEKKKMYEDAILVWREIGELYLKCQFPLGVLEAKNRINQLKTYNQQ